MVQQLVPGLSISDLSDRAKIPALRKQFGREAPPERVIALARIYREAPESRRWARAIAIEEIGAGRGRGTAFIPFRLFSEREPSRLIRTHEALARTKLTELDVADAFSALADAVIALDAGATISDRQIDLLIGPIEGLLPGLNQRARQGLRT